MRFYTKQHQYYCGIDLHTKMMYVCIIDSEENIPFLLGHALYMKAIHGGKTKNDKIDSLKIAKLIKGGNFPLAYPYPAQMRATRDLLRRRMYFVRVRSEVHAHIQLTNYQYNLPSFEKKIERKNNRADIAQRFSDPVVSKNVESDIATMDHFEELIKNLEAYIVRYAKVLISMWVSCNLILALDRLSSHRARIPYSFEHSWKKNHGLTHLINGWFPCAQAPSTFDDL